MMKKFFITLIAVVAGLDASAQQTLTLNQQQCREMALQNDERIKSMDNAQKQAEIDKQVAFLNYLPTVDGSLLGIYQFASTDMMGMKMEMKPMYMAGLTVQETLYAGGRIKAGNDLAEIGRAVAEQNIRKTRAEVLADVDNAYWTYVSVRKKVEMLKTYVEYIQSLFDQVKISVEAELAVENDLLRINAKKSEIQYNLQKAETGEDLSRMMLCNYIGIDLNTQITPADEKIEITMPENMDEDISNLPEMHLLNQGVQAKQKQVKMALGEYLPSLVGMFGYSAYRGIKTSGTQMVDGVAYPFSNKMKSDGASAMVMLSVPIWNWGMGKKSVKKAKLDVLNAQLDLQRNQRLLAIQARSAVKNVQNGYLQVQTAQLGAQQSEENLRVMNDRYENAMSTLTDLLDAQSQWQQAQSNLIEAQTQYKIYQTEYLKAVGRLE